MVSISSLTWPLFHARRGARPGASIAGSPTRIAGRTSPRGRCGVTLRDVVPRRPAPERPPAPCGRRSTAGPDGVVPAVRPRRPLLGTERRPAARPTSSRCCATSTSGSAACTWCRAARGGGAAGGRERRAPRACTSPPTTPRTRRRRDERGRAGARRGRRRARAHRTRRTPWRPAACARATASAYRVFTPFYRAWQRARLARARAAVRASRCRGSAPTWHRRRSPTSDPPDGVDAASGWARRRPARSGDAYLDDHVDDYDDERDRPGPRRDVADVGAPEVGHDPPAHAAGRPRRAAVRRRPGVRARAGVPRVLRRRRCTSAPTSAFGYYNRGLRADGVRRAGRATSRRGSEGRTGFPIVDAGMRQLLAEGWMHNRVRMIVASFLVKDLHLEWTVRRATSSASGSSTPTSRATSTAGSGWPAAAPTRRRTSASSTPWARARSSTPTAPTSGAGSPSCADVQGRARARAVGPCDEPPADYPPPIVDHARGARSSRCAATTRLGG